MFNFAIICFYTFVKLTSEWVMTMTFLKLNKKTLEIRTGQQECALIYRWNMTVNIKMITLSGEENGKKEKSF